MPLMSEKEFLEFVASALMYDEPLSMNVPMPDLVFDSTGKLLLSAAIESEIGLLLSLDDLAECRTPGEIYELVKKSS